MSMQKVIVFAETATAYEELCSEARALGAESVALFVGSSEEAQTIANFGARVLAFGEKPANVLLEDYVPVFEEVIKAEAPNLILMRTSKRVQCIAGRLAIRLDAPVVSDVSTIEVDDDAVLLTHLVYGGAAKQVERGASTSIALVSSGVFEVTETASMGSVEPQSVSIESGPIVFRGMEEKQEEVVDLGSAKRVVCVGRGVGSQENLAVVQELARNLGAEMACTRPIAEGEGWMARSRYLGVSGAVVKPDIYLAIGISGQVQHTVGVGESKIIAAINKDKNAPIFKQCDVGLIADIEKILPLLKV